MDALVDAVQGFPEGHGERCFRQCQRWYTDIILYYVLSFVYLFWMICYIPICIFGVSHLSLFLYESRLTNCFLFDLYSLEDFLVHSIEPDLILELYQSIQQSLSSFHASRAAVEK